MRNWLVGTRRSMLATTQTGHVIEALRRIHPDADFPTREIVTKGDRIVDVALAKVGGKGLFISEIEDALLSGEIHFAVHSMKDVPAVVAPRLTIAAIPRREDPRDLLLSKDGFDLESLPKGAVVGTSSLRRAAQLKRLRVDLQIEPLRGNIDTRLGKLAHLDAIVLAAAGLSRMNWWVGEEFRHPDLHVLARPLSVEQVIPAVGQGALAIECREEDAEVMALLHSLHDPGTALCVAAERAFLARVGGSCQVPVAAHATLEETGTGQPRIAMYGMIGTPDGTQVLYAKVSGTCPATIGRALGEKLLQLGGHEILACLAENNS